MWYINANNGEIVFPDSNKRMMDISEGVVGYYYEA